MTKHITPVLSIETAAAQARAARHTVRVRLGVTPQGYTLTSFLGSVIVDLQPNRRRSA